MLSFEIVESGRAIQIYVDAEGLSVLQSALEKSKTAGDYHTLSQANGGKELNDLNPWGATAISEVIITMG